MSIVGTRPPLISETNLYEPRHKARLAIKPGITGMWQVSGRSDITDFEEVVRLDKEYMGSYYQCSDPDSNEKNWTGHIRPLNINRNEFEVTARGSTFHLLVGKHAYNVQCEPGI